MKKYRVRYDAAKNYGMSYEVIDARGLVHAFKLAKDHMRELRKLADNKSIKIGRIEEIT